MTHESDDSAAEAAMLRARAHAELDRLLDSRDYFERQLNASAEPDEYFDADREPLRFVVESLHWLRRICGRQVIEHLYAPLPESALPEETLNRIVDRLFLASHLFGRLERDWPMGSLGSVAREAAAVAAGDRPVIFAKVGRQRNWREGIARLRALEWLAFCEAKGLSIGERETLICNAYGAPKATIDKWDIQARNAAGDTAYERTIQNARLDAQREYPHLMIPRNLESWEWRAAVVDDGRSYQTMMRELAQHKTTARN